MFKFWHFLDLAHQSSKNHFKIWPFSLSIIIFSIFLLTFLQHKNTIRMQDWSSRKFVKEMNMWRLLNSVLIRRLLINPSHIMGIQMWMMMKSPSDLTWWGLNCIDLSSQQSNAANQVCFFMSSFMSNYCPGFNPKWPYFTEKMIASPLQWQHKFWAHH